MGFWSGLLGGSGPVIDTYDPAQRVLPDPAEPWGVNSGWSVADPGVPLPTYTKTAVETFWHSQPNVRKVVDFIARSVATIPFHTYVRLDDDDRERVTFEPLPDLLSNPAPRVGPYRFWHGIISDWLLYDRWAAVHVPAGRGPERLAHIPSWRLHFETNAMNEVVKVWYWEGDTSPTPVSPDGWRELPLDTIIFDHGYAPRTAGLSPMVTLRDLLAESAEAVAYRRQVWANGARIPAWISRDLEAPRWSDTARNRFLTGFRASFTGRGENAGGIPLMEDGMKLNGLDAFKPQDTQDLEGRRLSAIEVASAFHIAPELVGAQQGNYSNVREYRQMLYRDSLGPYFVGLEQVLNVQLVPKFASGRPLYVEANVESKLRGSFEEQAQMLQTAVGAPWMLRSEARARANLPFVESSDELVVPLNVLIGDQASPTDAGEQNVDADAPKARRSVVLKNRPPVGYETKAQQLLAAFFRRQRPTVLSALGAKAADVWWDADRWDRELSDDLLRVGTLVSAFAAGSTLGSVGVSSDEYDFDRTLPFLRSVSDRIAREINETTKSALDATLASASENDRTEALGHVFDVAESSRAEKAATGLVTTYSGFGTTEAARQVAGDSATKTWVVTSTNPRPEHAALNGQTVGIDSTFSNGQNWPSGPGCRCDVRIDLGG